MKGTIKNHIQIFGCSVVLLILQVFLIRYISRVVILSQSTIARITISLIMILFTVIVFLLYLKRSGKETFLLNGISWKIWLLTFLLCISHFLFVSVLRGYPILNDKINIPPWHILLNFCGIFCYPVTSEILLRGLLQKQLTRITYLWLAIFVTTIVGAFVSLLLGGGLYSALLAGIFIGFIYCKTDKLILCILYKSFFALMHVVFQFSSKHIPSIQTLSLFLSITLAIYAIRVFLKDNKLKNNRSASKSIIFRK